VKIATLTASLVLIVSLPLVAQDASSLPSFEATSIKEAREPGSVPFGPGRFTRPYATLAQLLVYAHGVAEFQIVGGPDWVRAQRFEVQATAQGVPSDGQMQLMVRRLLAERFKLETHIETRTMPRYALVMAREDRRLGPKLRPSAVDCSAVLKDLRAARPAGCNAPREPRFAGGSMTFMFQGQPIAVLANRLQPIVRRFVVDKTGLQGPYDIELETELPPLQPGVAEEKFGKPGEGLALSTVLPEQLGLKLESERGPVELLVIDRVERPTPN
jgi:uncharacterized protein (TIGR03435 family)